jgi:cytochrome c
VRRAAFAACVLWAVSVAARAGQADGLALDAGAYSAEQAKRGKAHYDSYCAPCHVGDLSGTLAADTGAPPLRGAAFVTSMERKGVAAVFDYIKATMPADDPASLQDSEYLDILAYLIQANGFPPGGRELTAADLSRVRIRRTAVP